jgi:hypothetical protein
MSTNAPQQPVFLLCTMRSFSSLVCAMLGQHPQLYGLPEVNLFVADDIEGMTAYYQRRPHGMHGLLRTIAEIEFGSQTQETIGQASRWIDQRRAWSTGRLFRYIAAAVAPKRCVDKSPVTVRNSQFLARMGAEFADADFLHLTRHPRSCGDSIVKFHEEIDRQRGTHWSEQVDPETVWLRTNQLILEFRQALPLGQCLQLQSEELMASLHSYLSQIAEWLGLRTDAESIAAMLHPENSPYSRLGPSGAEYGNDPNFLSNPIYAPRPIASSSLDGELAWGQHHRPGFSAKTLKIARQMGYQ